MKNILIILRIKQQAAQILFMSSANHPILVVMASTVMVETPHQTYRRWIEMEKSASLTMCIPRLRKHDLLYQC